jgi:hypothetical protein
MHEQALLLQSVSIGFCAIGILTGVVPLPLLHKNLFRQITKFAAYDFNYKNSRVPSHKVPHVRD